MAILRQTKAILLEAYRELNSKRLFWVVLGLSLLCVAALAMLGIYDRGPKDRGITVLIWEIRVDLFDIFQPDKRLFYNMLFYTVGFQLWLTWAATILALVSTAGLIPEFIGGGAIELTLSKPIGRLRLFLTKYAGGLLFAALQVSVFTVASFVVIGLRSGSWQPSLFLAIPLVVTFFSYLFAFQVLIGMITRSTIASLLLTMLLWLGIFGLHVAEAGPLLEAKIRADHSVSIREENLRELRTQHEELLAREADPDAATPPNTGRRRRTIPELQSEIADKELRLADAQASQQQLNRIHALLFGAKSVLPKTSETMDLLERSLLRATDIEKLVESVPEPPRRRWGSNDELRPSEISVRKEHDRTLRARSPFWVLGTSLLFEALILAVAAWLFVRRDF